VLTDDHVDAESALSRRVHELHQPLDHVAEDRVPVADDCG